MFAFYPSQMKSEKLAYFLNLFWMPCEKPFFECLLFNYIQQIQIQGTQLDSMERSKRRNSTPLPHRYSNPRSRLIHKLFNLLLKQDKENSVAHQWPSENRNMNTHAFLKQGGQEGMWSILTSWEDSLWAENGQACAHQGWVGKSEEGCVQPTEESTQRLREEQAQGTWWEGLLLHRLEHLAWGWRLEGLADLPSSVKAMGSSKKDFWIERMTWPTQFSTKINLAIVCRLGKKESRGRESNYSCLLMKCWRPTQGMGTIKGSLKSHFTKTQW